MDVRADRTWCWQREPYSNDFQNRYASKIAEKYSEARHPGTEVERLYLQIRDLDLFGEGLCEEGPGRWDVNDRQLTIMDPFSPDLYLGNV